MLSVSDDFIEAYNQELADLRCAMRVATPVGAWHSGSLAILDETGREIGVVPDSVAPLEMAAFARLLSRRFVEGITIGEGRSSPLDGDRASH